MLVQSASQAPRLYGGGQPIIAAGQEAPVRQTSPDAPPAAAALPSRTSAAQLGGTSLSSLIETQAASTGVNGGRPVAHLIVSGYGPPAQAGGGVLIPKLPLASA